MSILIDPPAWPAHGLLWSHLVSDASYEELHAFAAQLRIPRRSFDLDHYDLPETRYADAIALGARAVSAKDVVHRLRDTGLRVRQVDKPALLPVRRREFLLTEWASLGRHATSVETATHDDAWRDLGDDLITRWNEPHRRYHDERHLEDVLLALDHLTVRGEAISPATLLAAWFHDAVYQGDAHDELNSARLASERLGGLGLAPSLVQQVGEFIVATTPGQASSTTSIADSATDLHHLLDADLSIFASSPARYAEYTAAVREEYAHVPDPDFAAGRSQILSGYLDQPTLYRTAAAQELWEARARANVRAEIARLGSGRPRTGNGTGEDPA